MTWSRDHKNSGKDRIGNIEDGVEAANGGPSRYSDLVKSLGWFAETFDVVHVNTGSAAPGSAVVAATVYLYAGEVITNLNTVITVAGIGTNATHARLGVWSSAATPVCVASTADHPNIADWPLGYVSFPLSAPYTVPTSGVYYLAFHHNGALGGSTAVNLGVRSGIAPATEGLAGKPWRSPILNAALTDMVVGSTGSYADGANIYWISAS